MSSPKTVSCPFFFRWVPWERKQPPPKGALWAGGREGSPHIKPRGPLEAAFCTHPNLWGQAVIATSAPSPASLTFCPVSYIPLFNQNLDPSVCQGQSLLDLWAQSLWESISRSFNLPTEAGSLLLLGFLEMQKFQKTKILYRIWPDLEFLKSLHRRQIY